MKTLEEQVSGKCIHFNGIMNKACKAGVEYESFGKNKMGVIPCLKDGTATCDKCQFPTPEEVEVQLKEMRGGSFKAISCLLAVKAHVQKTGFKFGEMKCPHGDHMLKYSIAPNDHARIACKVCEISMME